MEGGQCVKSSDCHNFLSCQDQHCVHDPLFPMHGLQILCYILIPIVVGIANVGGIGGGIVKVPILVLILNYSTQISTNISYPITLGGCLANIFLLLREKHPTQNKPLIDFGIAIILVPAILIGTNTGVTMNATLPIMFLNGFFILFLCVVCPYLANKGWQVFKLEKKVQVQIKELAQNLTQKLSDATKNEQIIIQQIQKEFQQNVVIPSLPEINIDSSNNQETETLLTNQGELQEKIEKVAVALQELREQTADKNSVFQGTTLSRRSSIFSHQIGLVHQESQQNQQIDESPRNNYLLHHNQSRKITDLLSRKHTSSINDESHMEPLLDSEEQRRSFTDEEFSRKNHEIQNQGLTTIPEQSIEGSFVINNLVDLQKGNETQNSIRKEIEKMEQKIIPYLKLIFLIVCLGTVTIFSFVLGNNSIFGFTKCDTGYWLFFSLQYLLLIALSLIALTIMKRELNLKKACGYNFDENDLQQLDLKSYIKLSGAGVTAGFIAGMLGVGAGLVIVPILLLLNVQTRVAAATSGFMYFFISFTSILNVLTSGSLGIEIIGWFTGLALIGGSLISPLVYWMVNKYKKQSFVIFIVFVIAFINIVCTIMYLVQVGGEEGMAFLMQFNNFCKAASH